MDDTKTIKKSTDNRYKNYYINIDKQLGVYGGE